MPTTVVFQFYCQGCGDFMDVGWPKQNNEKMTIAVPLCKGCVDRAAEEKLAEFYQKIVAGQNHLEPTPEQRKTATEVLEEMPEMKQPEHIVAVCNCAQCQRARGEV